MQKWKLKISEPELRIQKEFTYKVSIIKKKSNYVKWSLKQNKISY